MKNRQKSSTREHECLPNAVLPVTPLVQLCPKQGRIGTQIHLCRYEKGHIGLCTFQLAGAVPLVVPPPPWLQKPILDSSDVPGYVDDLVLPAEPAGHEGAHGWQGCAGAVPADEPEGR